MEPLSLLIIDDERRVLDEIKEFLQNKDYQVYVASTSAKAFVILDKQPVDIVILDVKLSDSNGIDVLRKIKAGHSEIEVIMISGHGDMDTVISAMREGAIDYFPKPFRLIDINNAILRAKRFIDLNKKLITAQTNIDLLSQKLLENIGGKLLGESSGMKHLKGMMAKVAVTDNTSVLILGESGTGKELVAHGIHQLSARRKNPFYSVNCSAIPESLFESEFFGHKKGSFTGAISDKLGWFETATEGTLFLDEISDMPLLQQAKLLRVLEDRKVSKIGSNKVEHVDVRVIAASNKPLERLAAENRFRLDLFHRLSIFVIEIPPLRERREDIPMLLEYYLQHYAQKMGKSITHIDDEVYKLANEHPFPGNIRQLKNCVERAVILCDGDTLNADHVNMQNVPEFMPSSNDSLTSINNIYNFDLLEHERQLILKAMEKSDNNKTKASNLLNITWQSLDRRMKKFGLE